VIILRSVPLCQEEFLAIPDRTSIYEGLLSRCQTGRKYDFSEKIRFIAEGIDAEDKYLDKSVLQSNYRYRWYGGHHFYPG